MALTTFSALSLQMKSNVLSLDCHISQYAAICEQLKAEVRNPEVVSLVFSGVLKSKQRSIP